MAVVFVHILQICTVYVKWCFFLRRPLCAGQKDHGLRGQTDLCVSLVVLCISCMNLAKLLNFTEPQGIIMHDLQDCYEDYVLNSKQFVWAMRTIQLPQSKLCLLYQYGCPWLPRFTRPLHNYIFPLGFTNLSISFFQHSQKIQMTTIVFLSWALKQSTLVPGNSEKSIHMVFCESS